MRSKLSIGLLALALLFGLSKPANAQGYSNVYGPGLYHSPDAIPYFAPNYYSPYYAYLAYYTYLAHYAPYYPGYNWWWVSWRR